MKTQIYNLLIALTIFLSSYSFASGVGEIHLIQSEITFDTVTEREPTIWEQYLLELVNHYRANPMEALVEYFPELLDQGDEFGKTLAAPPILLSTRVATELNIPLPNYTQYDE